MASSYLGSFELQPQYSGYDAAYGGSPSAKPQAAGMSPASAGMQVGGNMLSAYLMAQAQEEANRKQQLVDAAKTEGDMQQNALKALMGGFTSALR